ILGAITFIIAEANYNYGPQDLALAEDLARRAATAVDNARLYREARAAVTARERASALLDTMLAKAPVGLAFLDRELRYRLVNEEMAVINGVPVGEHLGSTVAEVFPAFPPQLETAVHSVLETGRPMLDTE